MKRNYSDGFSFLEVLIATTLAGLMVVALLNLQGTLLSAMMKSSKTVEQLIAMKNLLYIQEQKEPVKPGNSVETKEQTPVLVYSVNKISDSSKLNKIEDLVRITITSKLAAQPTLVAFRYQPSPQEVS